MLILLPPSEGKSAPPVGPRLDIGALDFPTLTPIRRRVLSELVRLCRDSAGAAADVLALGRTQQSEVEMNARLRSAPCAPAIEVYSGVLFEALDATSLTPTARRHANERVAISSALWGLVRPADLIPAYRLSGSVTLPGLGTLASAWRGAVPSVIESVDGLVVDLRSTTYVGLGPLPRALAPRAATVRVLQEREGRRTVVSHSNKATKGRVARVLVQERRPTRDADELADVLDRSGFRVETIARAGRPTQIDVVLETP